MPAPLNRAQDMVRRQFHAGDFGRLESFTEAFVGPHLKIPKRDKLIIPTYAAINLNALRPNSLLRWPDSMDDSDRPVVFILRLFDQRQVVVNTEAYEYCRYVAAFDLI